MLAFANVVHFLADELAGLRGFRLAFARVFVRSLDGIPFLHGWMLSLVEFPPS
ncbi:MAG TPA: hypothetical protein VL219_03915 [Steroidobacteraceae bacterium]|nr:hypothetical protein [Steroidobacteraceae bacterium]